MARNMHQDIDNLHTDMTSVYDTTFWRGKNPKITKVKFRDIQMKNRYDFGKSAPRRFKNFAWLKKNNRKDWFGVNGKDFTDERF